MMLEYSFDEKLAAENIVRAVKNVLKEGYRTKDICRKTENLCSTSKITDLIVEKIV